MKFLIVFALCVAAATARFVVPDVAAAEAAEIQQILDLIHHPNTDPATAAALLEMLEAMLNPAKPDEEGIAVGPIIIDEEDQHGIIVDPVIIEDEGQHGISVDPVIIAPVAPEAPAANSPLVNIIINVNTNNANDVAVEGSPVVTRPVPVEVDEEIDPTPVIVVDEPEAPVDPVIVAPIVVPEPVITLPEILN